MKSRLASGSTLTAFVVGAMTLALAGGLASAQPALDDEEEDTSATTPTESVPSLDDPADKTMFGVGFAVRDVLVPRGLIELFVDSAPGGSSETGFRLELARRKGDFEVQFGVEYEKIDIVDGLWVEKDKPIPANEPDYVQFENFNWITAEVSFLNHTQLAKQFAIRYGGGAGIGLLRGDVVRTDYACVSADPDTCGPYGGPNDHTPYDLPPVMLVVNAIVGVQIRPVDKVFINIEGGLRTIPFFGGTVGYYF